MPFRATPAPPDPAPTGPRSRVRTSAAERATAIALRTAHLVAVVAFGAALLGAPLPLRGTGLAALATGAVLAAMELRAQRMRLTELAGAVIVLKLALLGLAVAWPALAVPVFWTVVVLSGLSSHAPKDLRHWPGG